MGRRLAAIMVADIVGYSRLMGLDESGTIRRLKALRRELIDPAIKAAHGRIVKTMGDGLLVEFPSPLRAIACAVRIQQGMTSWEPTLPDDRRFRLRFGINVGDVVAQPDGDLFGDGVNVAARLEPLSEPGGLCISRSVHDQVRDKLPYRFEDKGKLELKNIARPIGVFALTADSIRTLVISVEDEDEAEALTEQSVLYDQSTTPIQTTVSRGRFLTAALIVVSVITVISVSGLAWWSFSPRAPTAENTIAVQNGLPAKPLPPLSLVVLPFANLGNDSEQDFFADGLTEDLTTDLSHLAGSFVIARNTAFTYKGKAVDVKQVGHDLGVRYVLEGSVRRTGEHVVLNAQLISTETGAHLWADRFEGERSRLGELQAEFVARLARSLDVQLTQAEGLRIIRERPSNPTASDLSMLGWSYLNRVRSPANTLAARLYFEKSLAVDPDNSQTKIGLARTIAQAVNTKVSKNTEADSQFALKLADEGLEANPQNPMAHYTKAEVLRATKDFELGLREISIAVEYDPNMAIAHALAGITNLWAGKAARTFEHVEKAIRLSPKDPLLNAWEYYICHAHVHLAQWEQAIKWCNRSVEHTPYYFTYIDLAVAHAYLGHKEAASDAVKNVLKLMPGFNVNKLANADYSKDPIFVQEYERIIAGARLAGLPEGP